MDGEKSPPSASHTFFFFSNHFPLLIGRETDLRGTVSVACVGAADRPRSLQKALKKPHGLPLLTGTKGPTCGGSKVRQIRTNAYEL